MQPNERKNMLAVVFGALIITACCAGHLILAGIGGLTVFAGFFTQSKAVTAIGLAVLLLGAFILVHSAKKSKGK